MTFRAMSACQLNPSNIGTVNEGAWVLVEEKAPSRLVWFDRQVTRLNMLYCRFAEAALSPRMPDHKPQSPEFMIQIVPARVADPAWANTAGGRRAWIITKLGDSGHIVATAHQSRAESNHEACSTVGAAWNRRVVEG